MPAIGLGDEHMVTTLCARSAKMANQYADSAGLTRQKRPLCGAYFRISRQGHSPQAIARMLNADRIPGPNGKPWRETAIRGHATRRTGILRNSLYVGQLIWNKQTYVRDPSSGKRVGTGQSGA